MVKIREIEIGDSELFVEFRKKSHSETPYVNTITEEKAHSLIEDQVNSEDKVAFLVFDQSKIVGQLFLTFKKPRSLCHINLISVLNAYQGKGIADQLLKKTDSVSLKEGLNTVELIVEKQNSRAIAFYKRHGFIETGTWGKNNLVFQKVLKVSTEATSLKPYYPIPYLKQPGFFEIPGYSRYAANAEGDVLNKRLGNATKGGVGGQYRRISAYPDGASQPRLCYAHDLVCRAFCGSPPPNHVVLHKDNNKLNTAASNLSWGTQSQNITDMWADGLRGSKEDYVTSEPLSANW